MSKQRGNKIHCWACIDITDHYWMEVFPTENEAEAYRRGVSKIEDGKFKIVQVEITVKEDRKKP